MWYVLRMYTEEEGRPYLAVVSWHVLIRDKPHPEDVISGPFSERSEAHQNREKAELKEK